MQGVVRDLGDDGRPVGFELPDAASALDGVPQGVELVILNQAAARATR